MRPVDIAKAAAHQCTDCLGKRPDPHGSKVDPRDAEGFERLIDKYLAFRPDLPQEAGAPLQVGGSGDKNG
jgi:hypothetical protein